MNDDVIRLQTCLKVKNKKSYQEVESLRQEVEEKNDKLLFAKERDISLQKSLHSEKNEVIKLKKKLKF